MADGANPIFWVVEASLLAWINTMYKLHMNLICEENSLQMFFDLVLQIKCQQMSHAVRFISFLNVEIIDT
jgi:hypothetical protein